MTRDRAGRGKGIAPRYLAGWLFADLFLALFVIALALGLASSGGPSPSEAVPPAPGTGESEPPKNAGPGGIDPHYRTIEVTLGRGATGRAPGPSALRKDDVRKVVAAVDKEMNKSGRGRRIGMVITFGSAPKASLENGEALAQDINEALKNGRRGAFCGKNVGLRNFWSGGADDHATIEIYYINRCDAPKAGS
ncbi:hypothetical protein [Streptomyces sp. NPDC047024]|uniref:hypothetical protein n=1 Tax=Streptomyces sp. NPDC047024 TaxID=3155476 RepID=UPI0033EA38AA